MRRSRLTGALLSLGLVAGVVAPLSGCGSSSKPSYCAEQEELKKNVQALGEVNVVQGGTNAVTSALQKVEGSAKGLVEAAKSEFPAQTQALESSLSALSKTVGELTGSPTKTSAITAIPAEVTALGTAVQQLSSATSSKCG
jgi:hypothetical protein